MRNLFLTFALSVLASSAVAVETKATLEVASDFVYRGQLVTEDPSVAVSATVGDILGGLFVTGTVTSTELTPLTDTVRVRSDFGVGYAVDFSGLAISASVNRVFNPVLIDNQNYNEFRLTASYGWVFAELGQGLTSDVNVDTYLSVGAKFEPIDRLTVGGLVSAVRYDQDSNSALDFTNSRFNNAELFASYNLWRGLDVFANYTYGLRDAFGQDISNRVYGGIRYNF